MYSNQGQAGKCVFHSASKAISTALEYGVFKIQMSLESVVSCLLMTVKKGGEGVHLEAFNKIDAEL